MKGESLRVCWVIVKPSRHSLTTGRMRSFQGNLLQVEHYEEGSIATLLIIISSLSKELVSHSHSPHFTGDTHRETTLQLSKYTELSTMHAGSLEQNLSIVDTLKVS